MEGRTEPGGSAPAAVMRGPLILASASATRAEILRRAGVAFTQVPAALDEDAAKAALRAAGVGTGETALRLAEDKARWVWERHPDATVIGADQMLECADMWFDKPVDTAAARAQLEALRGRTHRLVSSVCVIEGGARKWHHTETAELEMRLFSDQFLDAYLLAAGPHARDSVGGYQLEGLGAQLFTRIDGDYFAILGLPLLPLLAFLRGDGAILA